MMSNRVCIVTGAASGIGMTLAKHLSNRFTVVGIDIRPSKADFKLLQVDVTDRQAMVNAADKIEKQYGPISVLVNNAGVLTMNRFLDLSDEEWKNVFSVNVYGVFLASQIFGRKMIESDGGRIINIASVAGKIPLPDQAHYCASKAAVIMLTRTIALELSPMGIQAYAICPGAVNTELFQHCLQWSAEREGREPEELLSEWLEPSRIGRMVKSSEVAELVCYLATGPAEPLTGHAISIDGGVSPW